jgi:ubiquinone/menaquinone biosynthesis C-methylase UbiE
MQQLEQMTLRDVQAVYGGPECDLWQLLMGCQIHIGGMRSSMRLADKAGIKAGSRGVDLCCCRGAGMHFLIRCREVAAMTGVDATNRMVTEGREWAGREGLADRIRFVLGPATETGLPAETVDFVWGEDAWCYVQDKRALIAEAARLVRPGGTIAFTDWLEGPAPLSPAESRRFMQFMKFPSLATLDDYRRLLEANGCRVQHAEDTGEFAGCVDLYMRMVEQQLTFDALRILGFDRAAMEYVAGEMNAVRTLAREGKLIQGLFVAVRD